MTSPDIVPTPDEIQKALEIARNLIKAGVPVFAAPPIPGSPGQYRLPAHWQKTIASETWLDEGNPMGWKPGWALGAVGGTACDFLDVDPRNGGAESLAEIIESGQMPHTLGQQGTPSGGNHYITHLTGDRKSNSFMPGLDMQAGGEGGEGRGFVFIAPTVRPSKDPADGGALRPYVWAREPEYDQIGEFSPGADPSLDGIRARIEQHRNRGGARESGSSRVTNPADPDDPFTTPGRGGLAGLFGGQGGHDGPREFTTEQAKDFLRPFLESLAAAQIGNIEESCNVAAAALYHFVPEFWSADGAMAILSDNLSKTAYDPNGPSDWTVEKFRAVLDGRRPPHDAWKAVRREEPPAAPAVTVETEPGEETLSTYEKLRRRMMTASELAARPPAKPLIHGVLNLNTEAWMIGAPGSLKSFVALDMAGRVGRGEQWQGHHVSKGGVFYIAAEGEEGMTLRTRAWEKINGPMAGVTFLPYPVQVKSSDGQWDALVQIVREDQPAFIVVDTQHRVSVGLEENSATDMGVLIAAVGRLKRASGACVLVIHHTGRDGGNARGSSALDGAQDTELHVKRGEPREWLTARVIQDKQKDMAESGGHEGIPIQFEVIDLGVDESVIPPRALSSLVMMPADRVHAEMVKRSGFTEGELDKFKGVPVEEWTKRVPGVAPGAKVQKMILQVLADHAHDIGLTEAKAKQAVISRWYGKDKAPEAHNFTDAWRVVCSSEIAVNLGGERWALDQAILNGIKSSETL